MASEQDQPGSKSNSYKASRLIQLTKNCINKKSTKPAKVSHLAAMPSNLCQLVTADSIRKDQKGQDQASVLIKNPTNQILVKIPVNNPTKLETGNIPVNKLAKPNSGKKLKEVEEKFRSKKKLKIEKKLNMTC